MATVYAVASSKGGVGKTTTTVNLGAALAAAGLSVAVVDGDIGMANLGDALGVDPVGATLHDVLAGEASTEEATYDGPEGLAVLPGDTSIDGFRSADPANLSKVLADLAEYDYILVDTGAGLSHDTVLPLGLADEVVLVSTTERDSLTDTEKTRQVVERLGGKTRGVVLTSVDPDDPNAVEVAERLHTDVIEAIPVDPAVRTSMRLAEPLSSYAPMSPAARAYRALAGSLTGETIPTPEGVAESEMADDAPLAGTDGAEVETTDTDADSEGGDETGDVDADADSEVGDETDDIDADSEVGDEIDDLDAEGVTLGSPAEPTDDEGITLTEPDEETDSANDETDDEVEADDPSDGAVTADEPVDDDIDAEADDADTDDVDTEADNADDADTGADENSGLTDNDALAADTSPSDDPLVADNAGPEDEEEEPTFDTTLVEEAEPTEETAADEDDEEQNLVESDGDDDEEDKGGRKGFLGRLLG